MRLCLTCNVLVSSLITAWSLPLSTWPPTFPPLLCLDFLPCYILPVIGQSKAASLLTNGNKTN